MTRRLKGIEEFDPMDVRRVRLAGRSHQPASVRRPHRVRAVAILLALVAIGVVGAYAYLVTSKGPPRTVIESGTFTTSLRANVFGIAGRPVPAMTVTGRIMPSAAQAFSTSLDRSGLKTGDAVVLSTLDGTVEDAMAIGQDIRRRGLNTLVGRFDDAGAYQPASCTGACLLAFAGGVNRIGMPGITLEVARPSPEGLNPPGDAVQMQARAGRTVGYMTAMGVSPLLFQRMAETEGIKNLGNGEAMDLRLLTVMGE